MTQPSHRAPCDSTQVVLCTLNARYAHASLGLRYLYANAGDLQSRMSIMEFVCGQPTVELAQRLLACRPRILALGIYIWNATQSLALVQHLKAIAPEVKIVLGGPEVSHETQNQAICALADHVVQGPGDISFPKLIRALLDGPKPLMRIIAGEQPDLDALTLPYRYYTDRDLRERFIYVEASRGCPFKCEFCLSSLDKTAWAFPLDTFLDEMALLHRRGARRFKFVDRTFNLKIATSLAIMEFFLERIEATPDDPCFVHFELIPDHLPDRLKASIARFPPGTLQFEIGIQTFEPLVQQLISRRQDNDKAEANLHWLLAQSHAHLHVDLIAGLPAETMASFASGFDRLARINPHEIQIGILKRLRGAPIARHVREHGLHFAEVPPYEVIATATMSAAELDEIKLLARFHDLVANNGRMPRLAALVLAGRPFDRMMALSRHLLSHFGRTHAIGLEALFDAVLTWLESDPAAEPQTLRADALADYRGSGAQGRLSFMARGLTLADTAATLNTADPANTAIRADITRTANPSIPPVVAPAAPTVTGHDATPKRQSRHLRIDTAGTGVL